MLFARFFRDRKGGVAPSSRSAGTVNWNNAKLRVALARRHRINVVERKMTALKTASRLVVDRRARKLTGNNTGIMHCTVQVNTSGDPTSTPAEELRG